MPLERTERGSAQYSARATVNGGTLYLLVDTGCPITTIKTQRARHIRTLGERRVKVKDAVLGLLSDPKVLLIDELKLGECTLTNQPARAETLTEERFEVPYDGVLGLDFLRRNGCLLDWGTHTLYIQVADPGPGRILASTLARSRFTSVPLLGVTRLGIDVRVAGRAVPWIVDTGSWFTIIDEDERRGLGLSFSKQLRPGTGSHLLEDASGEMAGFEKIGLGSFRMRVATVPALEVGGQSWAEFHVGVTDQPLSRLNHPDSPDRAFHGLLGADVLERFGALIDCGDPTLWLRPGA